MMHFGNSDIIGFTMGIIKPSANSHSVILKMALVDCVIDEMSLLNFVFLIILIFFQFVKQITYFNASTSGDQSLWMHIYSFGIALTEFILGNLR